MKYIIKSLIICILFVLMGPPTLMAGSPDEIVVMTHDSFNIGQPVVETFEKRQGVRIKFLKAGDAGAALNQALLTKNHPLADVFYGVDNTFLSRALEAGIFSVYASPRLKDVRDELKLDSQNRLLPVDFGDVCLNYDKKWFSKKGLNPPSGLEDLVKPKYRKLTVVQNPATSSPGLAFLLTTIGYFGENQYLDYWKKLKKNDLLIVNGWKEAYWGAFTAASKGNRPIVVSYASSPPVEVLYSETPLLEAPTAAITASGTCFRQIEFVGILNQTPKRKLAEKLVDFMLDKTFQEDIPLQMFMFPSNRTAKLPSIFVKHTRIAENPVALDPEKIARHRENWIESWTETVLR